MQPYVSVDMAFGIQLQYCKPWQLLSLMYTLLLRQPSPFKPLTLAVIVSPAYPWFGDKVRDIGPSQGKGAVGICDMTVCRNMTQKIIRVAIARIIFTDTHTHLL
jgi:hypothetical protein